MAETLRARVAAVAEEVRVAVSAGNGCDNRRRRVLHSRVELLRLDVEESVAAKDSSDSLCAELDALIPLLSLRPVERPNGLTNKISRAIRLLGVSSSIVVAGAVFSLPLLALRVVDRVLRVDPFHSISEYVKRAITLFILFQSGIQAECQGLTREHFKESCSLMTFTHASNLDGFVVAGTCPIRQLAFGKKELFVVPFFSWLSLAIGGVPVDRSNRDRAVLALKRTLDSAKQSKMCIAIAPEGTRSLTGQLLPFKKGTFYMWDELRAPIIPFLIFGAYDLYPVGSWVNVTGKVTVRYLAPIYPHEAASKDEMLRILRRRMLESIMDCPDTIGQDVPLYHKVASITLNLAMMVVVVALGWLFRLVMVDHFHLNWWQITFVTTFTIFFITAALYVYYVYIVNMGRHAVIGSAAAPKAEDGSSSSKSKKRQ